MSIKTKPLTERGHLGFNNTGVNRAEANGLDYKVKIRSLLTTNELSSYVGRFKYKNLPLGMNGEIIETMLYYKGQLAMFKLANKYYILPFVYAGTVNHLGLQEEIIPIPFNGTIDSGKSIQSFAGNYKALLFEGMLGEDEYNEEDVAVVLRERSGLYLGATPPTIALTDQLLDKLAENVLLVRNNILLSHPVKYVTIESQDKSTSVNSQMANIFNNILEGKLIQTVVGHLKFDDVSTNPPSVQVQQLWQNFASLNSLRLTSLGITNNGSFEKRERILTDEISGKQAETELILDDHLLLRQNWVDLINKVWGLNVSVALSDTLKPKEVVKVDNREGNQSKSGYEVEDESKV